MQTLPLDYLAELARQFAFVSAFLGGFAATFLATLLTIDSPKAVVGWIIGSAACAAVAFVTAAVSAVMLAIVLHPDAPINIKTDAAMTSGRIVMSLGFVVGVYALFLSVGLSGWIRSRNVGWVTSLVASLSTVAITGFIVG